MPKTVAIAQVKGGCGRSTVSTNLAAELSKLGKTVLIDGDMPQGTSASWFVMRQQVGSVGNLVCETAKDHRELMERVQKHQDAAYIVIDGPPRIAEVTRAMLVLSDLCIVPVGASVPEIWATTDVLAIIEEAKKIRPIDARIVWTRHRGYTKLAKELSAQAKAELGLPIMDSVLALRVAYPDALGGGQSVAELSDATAKAELSAFVGEVLGILVNQ
jgi:chromosome partitioning protein